MRATLPLMLAAAAFAGVPAALAAEIPIDIKTDVKGQYFIIEQGGSQNNPTLTVKRTWGKGSHYIKRVFDCKAHTVKYLGEGESLDEMNKPLPGQKMTPIVAGSIPDQLARHACQKR